LPLFSREQEYGVEIIGYDPLLNNIESDFGIQAVYDLKNAKDIDGVMVTVTHDAFKEIGLDGFKKIMRSNPLLIDIRGMFRKEEAQRKGFHYKIL
jgi:UDP-N-acetyl-D-galactosamine dehydrogenase